MSEAIPDDMTTRKLTPEQQTLVVKHRFLAQGKGAYYFNYFCALSKKPSDGDTQSRDTMILRREDMIAAMNEALCEAAINYDPSFRATDGTPRTFGVYVLQYFYGAAMTLFRQAMRKRVRLPSEEIMNGHLRGTDKWTRPDDTKGMPLYELIPDKSTLPDGSDYDGQPGEGMAAEDRRRIHAGIAAIKARPGLVQMLPVGEIADMLMRGHAPGDLLKEGYSAQDVDTVVGLLRHELSHMVEDRVSRPLIKALRLGKTEQEQNMILHWLKEGTIPGTLGADKIWRVTVWQKNAIMDLLSKARDPV